MTDSRLGDGSVKLLRLISIVLGIVLILSAVFANLLGLSISRGISRNQIGIGLAGASFVVAGILGRRFPGFYKGTAVLLLNIVVLVLAVDFLALVFLKVFDADRFSDRRRKMEAAGTEADAHIIDQGRYAPYVVWRANPAMAGEGLSITEEGCRITPGASRDPEAIRVFLLGGSAMWGSGVTDSCTIPFYLQGDLRERLGRPVDTVNLAQSGFSSTQEVIELMLRLGSGDIPDVVIFYDGYNDIWAAYTNGFAGGHHQQAQVAERVEGRSREFQPVSPVELAVRNSNVWLLVLSLRGRSGADEPDHDRFVTYSTMGIDADGLAEDVVRTYLGNCRVADALGDSFGFDCIFIWQPVIWQGDKPLTSFEEEVLQGGVDEFPYGADPAFRELVSAAYGAWEDSAEHQPDLYSFTDIFDTVDQELYIDYCGAHVNASANSLIAGEMADLLSGSYVTSGQL